MTENYERLIKLLKELFQIDRPDLDFGIYRIMNQKRDEITTFLDKDLLPQVQKAFASYGSGGRSDIQAELDKMVANLKDAGIDPDSSPKVLELKDKLNASVDVTELENEVYSHLYNFFRRYYKDGDFLSLRRYKKDVYAIPYEGEEVKLHWANADQYYVKSSENFRDYTFKLGELPDAGKEDNRKTVHFKLVEADTELANNKAQEGKERRFVLCSDSPMLEEDGELVIRFEYKPLAKKQTQKNLNESAVKTLVSNPEFADWVRELAKEANGTSVLAKHLNTYTAKNSFDYFIHKDLGGFLRRELDFFVKNEVMHLDDIEEETAPRVEQYLSQIKVLRFIAHKIIRFLEQLENFQKKLWLKKKFVVETNYCITLDRVPEELYPEICANDAQREEWVRLFAIDRITPSLTREGYSIPLSESFLKTNRNLVIDTKHFNLDFKSKIVSNLNVHSINGLVIKADNFQALNILQNKFSHNIKTVYIDPPYNTGRDGFVYKDGFKTSSWISFLDSRLKAAKKLLSDDALVFISNDDNENENLKYLLNSNEYIFKTNLIWNTDGHTDNQFEIKVNHEYITLAQNSVKSDYGNVIDPNTREESNLWKNIAENSITKNGPVNPFSEVTLPAGFPVNNESGKIDRDVPCKEFYEELGDAKYYPRQLIKKYKVNFPIKLNDALYTEFKLNEDLTVSAGWANLNKLKKFIDNGCKPINDGGDELSFYLSERGTIYYKKTKKEARNIVSVLRGFTTTEKMKYELEHMGIEFSYPKPKDLISYLLRIGNTDTCLDFFAGSGTTAHSIIDLNREDGGSRKYILVEFGSYFDTLLLERIKKVVYSDSWDNSIPISTKGSSHALKYLVTESYEDTLNNLEFKQSDAQGGLLSGTTALKEEYMLSYMMDLETEGSASLLNVDRFDDPWNYTMKIATGSAGETKVRPVDLVETFNYLIGLTVIRRDFIRGIEVIEGTNPEGDNVLVIWRNTNETNNEQLDEFFRKQDYNTRDTEFDLIYVNGDNNLENLKKPDETWKVRLIEEDFKRLMFEVEDV